MSAPRKWLIAVAAVGASWGVRARAEDLTDQQRDQQLLEMSQAETVEIFDERPDKPFDRDTEVRLTGEQLAARGATDLATALALLPDVSVRDAGRGGFNVDIRGARKGAVSILVDGVLVTDPYHGTFDVSTIPITDIVQIRVSTTPQSPIDGPGGPGGVIEVLTRDGYGEQIVIARATGDSLPSAGLSGTARVALAKTLGLRIAMSGLAGARDMRLPMDASIGEQRRAATGSTRLEYREGDRRIVIDGFLDDRHYVSPPSEDSATAPILLIDRETTERVSAKADEKYDKLQVQAQGWVHHLARRSRYFRDEAFTDTSSFETLRATRVGAMALATQPLGKTSRWVASASLDHDGADVKNSANTATGDVTLLEAAGDYQFEVGTVRVDAAAGAATPLGVGADPWPEGKLSARWRPRFGPLEIVATAARKGRVPTLRERFDPGGGGNAALGPEKATHGELRAIYTIVDRLRVEAAPFYKRTTGTVRTSLDPADLGMLVNLGKLTFFGVDTQARVTVHPRAEVGASYSYIHVKGDTANPIDRLPAHRTDVWVQVIPERRVTVTARAHYYGDSFDKGKPVTGYGLVEVTAVARLSPEHLAVLRIDDALNERPETRAGYHAPGRVVMLVLQGQWK